MRSCPSQVELGVILLQCSGSGSKAAAVKVDCYEVHLNRPQNSDSAMHPDGAAQSVFFCYQPSGITEELRS